MKKLGRDDFLDIAIGGTVLGTGGGGSLRTAESIVNGPLRGKEVRLASPHEVPMQAHVLPVAGMGAPEAMLKSPLTVEALHAYDALVGSMQSKFPYVMPLETSGFNFLVPMTVAASRGVVAVDGDGAGRAIPRLNQTLFFSRDIPVSPLALANAKGEKVVITATRYDLAEKLAITALGEFGWMAGLACYPMVGRKLKEACVAGTISLAREVGRAIRSATAAGGDPVAAVLEVTGGLEIIRGTVDRLQSETRGSYSFGLVEIRGAHPFEDSRLIIKSMNENMIAWKNGRLRATAPDRICYITPDGRPVTNADISPGESISVFILEAQRKWRNPTASGLFSETLEAMGHASNYVPARELG